MSDFIDGLERDLVAAARRMSVAADGRERARLAPWSLRTALLAAVIAFGAAGAAAAATLYTLRGSVIPAPAAADVQPSQTPVPSSVHVSSLRVADPRRGVAPWTIRVAKSDTGYVCSTVGQVVAERFGLIGMDGRFREFAPGVTDSCGQEQTNAVSLVGARTFAARRSGDVRTVISGVAGDTLRGARLTTAQGTSDVARGEGGAFVAVLAGYPEDVAAEITLTFADGHRTTERLGADPSLVLDPEGGPAWRTQSFMVSGDVRQCVSFGHLRHGRNAATSPAACGVLGNPQAGERRRRGFFLAVRRLPSAAAADRIRRLSDGNWRGAPARTAVWGQLGDDVRSVSVSGPAVPDHPLTISLGRAVLGVFPASVRPRSLRIRVTMKDGTIRTVRGDSNLVDKRVPVSAADGRRMREAFRRRQARESKRAWAAKVRPKDTGSGGLVPRSAGPGPGPTTTTTDSTPATSGNGGTP